MLATLGRLQHHSSSVQLLPLHLPFDTAGCGRGCVCLLSLDREPIPDDAAELNRGQVQDRHLRACSSEARKRCVARELPSGQCRFAAIANKPFLWLNIGNRQGRGACRQPDRQAHSRVPRAKPRLAGIIENKGKNTAALGSRHHRALSRNVVSSRPSHQSDVSLLQPYQGKAAKTGCSRAIVVIATA